jgi:ABC-type multidrug transport system fused ATPase/permease subunit
MFTQLNNTNINTLTKKEERGEGSVGLHIYKSYFDAANKPFLLGLVLLSFLLANASQVLQQWVVALWTSDTGYAKRPLPMYLGSVAAMAFCVAFFNWSRTFFGVLLGAESSQTLHSRMARTVLNAPLSYFGNQTFILILIIIVIMISREHSGGSSGAEVLKGSGPNRPTASRIIRTTDRQWPADPLLDGCHICGHSLVLLRLRRSVGRVRVCH